MDEVDQVVSVARRVGLAAPAFGAAEVAPEDPGLLEITADGHSAEAWEKSAHRERSGNTRAHTPREKILRPPCLASYAGGCLSVIPKPDAKITKVVAAVPITKFVKIARLSLRQRWALGL